jgi:histidinol dehydrogenase
MTAPSAIRRLNAADADFARHLDHLLSWESVSDDGVNERVLEIIKAVRERGDAAVVELTQRFDALEVASMADLILPRARLALWRSPPSAYAAITSGRNRTPGPTPKPMARCSVRRSPRWIAPASTCRAARLPTRLLC